MRLLGAVSGNALLGLVPEQIRGLLPGTRRVQPCPGGVRIALRAVGGPGTEQAAFELEGRLRDAGAERAEVNGALSCVFVACEPDTADMDKFLTIVGELDRRPDRPDRPDQPDSPAVEAHDEGHSERQDEVHDGPDGGAGAVRPGHREHGWIRARDAAEHHARTLVGLGASVVGAGLAVAGQVTRTRLLPPVLPALLQVVEHTPRLRREVDRRLGVPAAEIALTSARLVVQTMGVRPTGLMIDSIAGVARYVDARAGRRAWARREEEFAGTPGGYRHLRTAVGPRPAELPRGPIERYADLAGLGALAGQGVAVLSGRGGERALSVLIAATPKAATMGRDAFAGAVGRALGARDTIVLDRRALRRMDRVDTVVLDAAVLTTGRWTIDGVAPVARDVNADELHARIYSLLDLTDPDARPVDEGWTAEPYTGSAPAGVEEPPQVVRWRGQGLRTVAVSREGTLIAVVGLAPELHPLAEAVVAAAKSVPTVLVAGGEAGLDRLLGVEQAAADGGTPLVDMVRRRQAEGHGVAVVSSRARRALAAADLGIGVLGDLPGRVPWDADVIGGYTGTHLLLHALGMARKASVRSLRITVTGGLAGGGLAVFGPPAAAVRTANLVGDAASLAALVAGEWAGRRLGGIAPPVPADRTPWHAMGADDVLARLDTSPDGLTEAEAARRRKRRRPATTGPASLLSASVEELANPLTPVLAAGAGISALVGSALDAGLIGGVMFVDALLGGAQRRGADRALHRLDRATAAPVRLRRRDRTGGATAADLVVGDVVELRAGDAVTADCRLLRASGLEMDESALTGESQLVTKDPAPTAAPVIADRRSMVYQGTTVAAGHGLAVVVATGTATEAGRTAGLTAGGPPESGVELRLRALSRRILPASIGSGLLLMGVELLRGSSPATALAPAVSLAVAAVPEGLPFIATVAELAAAKRLSTRNTLVRNPSTIEALGRVDVLCFDKTGTLTEGHITLRRVSDGWSERPVEEPTEEMRAIVAAALRAGPRTGGGRAIPHPTDRAVVDGAERLGVTATEGVSGWRRVDEMPFEPARGYHAVIGATESEQLLSVKGAPEIVLTRCSDYDKGGERRPLDERARRELEEEVERLALQGYRVLAVAERPASSRADLDESRIERLCFRGFLGLADPVRPTAARSVDGLMRAGVRIIMITGDHPSTAEAIAAEVNAVNGLRVMTGPELDALDDDELIKMLPEVSVFARVTPAHKARIVSCLRRSGKVVAVTGDGANDVPAIRLADVGVALGARATPAAREAADIVVTDDRIETIIDAIVEGRAMWGSVRESLGILLGGNVGEIVFTVGSSLLTRRGALNARQLLLVNLLTDMLPAMAVAVRPPSAVSPERLMAEGPEASLGAALTRDIYLRAVTTAASATAAWTLARATGTRGRADTVGLIGLVTAQLMQTLAAGRRDRMVALAALSSFAALGVIVSVPGLSQVFGCRPVGPMGWCIGVGSAAAATLLGGAMNHVAPEPVVQ
jgi:cation-transporting ATPase I